MPEKMPEGNWTPIAVNHGNEKDEGGGDRRFTAVILRDNKTGHLMHWNCPGEWSVKQLKGEADDG